MKRIVVHVAMASMPMVAVGIRAMMTLWIQRMPRSTTSRPSWTSSRLRMLGEGYTELETTPEGTDSAYQSELGYAFNVHASGFSGELHILVAIDNNGAIIASKLYQHTETPNEYEGIDGAKLSKSSYSKKWIGVTAETPEGDLPMVSKATFTSNGYKEAVKLAFAAYETVKGA